MESMDIGEDEAPIYKHSRVRFIWLSLRIFVVFLTLLPSFLSAIALIFLSSFVGFFSGGILRRRFRRNRRKLRADPLLVGCLCD